MTVSLQGIYITALVFARISGMILLNPLLARRNIPVQMRMGLVLLLTLLIAAPMPLDSIAFNDTFSMIMALLRETLFGFVLGYVFQIFYYFILFAGDLLDVEFGMSMAKVFDPSTNVQMSLTGNLLTVLFVLYFFAVDGMQQMIYLFAATFQAVPLGGAVAGAQLATFGMELFISVFALMFRLVLPFMAAEFALQVALGILMKLIPQIHIFVINFQLKQGLGIFMLFLFAPAIGGFVDRYVILLFENMQRAVGLLMGG